MVHETIFYVNHKPRKRRIEDLGSGMTLKRMKGIPKDTPVWVKYVEDEGRKPYMMVRPRDQPIETSMNTRVDGRWLYLVSLDIEGWEFLNNKLKAKRRK